MSLALTGTLGLAEVEVVVACLKETGSSQARR